MRKKEIVIQRDITDCGPCCLLSIIRHHNGNVPLEKIRLDTYAGNGGTSAYNLIKASNKYGFDSAGLNVSDLNEIKSFPCIAHVILNSGLNHYVVIYKIINNKIILMDPAKGKVILNKKDFLEIWDNIIITFHPINKILRYPVQNSIISFFYKLILQDKKCYIKIIILSIIISLLNLLISFFLKIGNYILNNNLSIIFSIISFLLIVFIKNSLILIHNNNYINLNNKVYKNLVSHFIFHIFSLPSILLHSRTSGEIMTRMNELGNIKDLLSELIIGLVLDALVVINGLIVLCFLNIKMTVFIMVILFFYFLISNISSKRIDELLRKWIDKDTLYNENLLDTIKMYSSIINLQIKAQIFNNLDCHLIERINEDIRLKKYISFITYIKNLVYDIFIIFFYSYALHQIYLNKMDLINFITYNSIFLYLFNSYSNILNILPEYYYLKNSIFKLSEFLNLDKEKDMGIKKYTQGDLVINNLSFSYNNEDWILKNINLRFKYGENYFIRGRSGSGKSTLLKIIYKELNNYKGNIYINNINYKDIHLDSLRNNVIITNQNEELFSGTIYQNIICYRDIKEKDFNKVCKICLVDNVVSKKPLRYLSNIKDTSTNLSGGEKQQILLARNLLKKGSIIIIDEALSEVDIKTEKQIINNLKYFYKDKTIIYVSHKKLDNLFNNKVTI